MPESSLSYIRHCLEEKKEEEGKEGRKTKCWRKRNHFYWGGGSLFLLVKYREQHKSRKHKMSALILHYVHACQSNAGLSLPSIKKKNKKDEKLIIREVMMKSPPSGWPLKYYTASYLWDLQEVPFICVGLGVVSEPA